METLQRLGHMLVEEVSLTEMLAQTRQRQKELLAQIHGQVWSVTASDAEWYSQTIATERRHGPTTYWRLDRTFARSVMAMSARNGDWDDPSLTVVGRLVAVCQRPMVEIYDPPGPHGALKWEQADDFGLIFHPLDTNVSPPGRMLLLGSVDWSRSRLVEPAAA